MKSRIRVIVYALGYVSFCFMAHSQAVTERSVSAEATVHHKIDNAPSPQNDKGADVRCGTDRRCRINRLKRLNRARRKIANLRVEEQARALSRAAAKAEGVLVVRGHKPYSAHLVASTLSVLSASLGFAPSPHFRVEGKITFQQGDYLNNGYMENPLWVEFSGVYLPLTSKLTPFVAAGAFAGSAQIYGSNYSEPPSDYGAREDTSGDIFPAVVEERALAMKVHGVQLAIGADLQATAGGRLQLGIMYRQPIYVQARYGKADYDKGMRKEIRRWFSLYNRWDLFLMYGWAF